MATTRATCTAAEVTAPRSSMLRCTQCSCVVPAQPPPTLASWVAAADGTARCTGPARTLLQTALFSFTSSRTSEVFITRFANLRISLTARGACFLTAARGTRSGHGQGKGGGRATELAQTGSRSCSAQFVLWSFLCRLMVYSRVTVSRERPPPFLSFAMAGAPRERTRLASKAARAFNSSTLVS